MIRKVEDIGFKNIKHNKFIVVSSIFSIMIALIIFLSMFNFIVNSEKTLIDNIHKVYGDMDISISYTAESYKDFTQETLDKIINKEGIHESSEVLIDFLYVEESDTYIAGLEDNGLAKSRYKYTSSLKNNSIIINTGLAQRLNKDVGDTVEIENKLFTIKEVLENDKNNSAIPNILIMDINNLREFTGRVATGVMVKLDKAVISSVSFANEVKEIDKDLNNEIIEENEAVKANLQNLKIFIYIIGILILIMSGSLILINFDTFLYKYRKDFSILRAIGANGKQCFKVVFVQSTFINVLGCLLGFIISYLLNSKIIKLIKPLFNFEVEIYEFDVLNALIITVIVAIIIEIMMLIPAYKASKILPLKINEENESLDIKRTSNIFTYFIYFIAFSIYSYGVIFKKDKSSAALYALVSVIFIIVGTIIYVRKNIQFILNKLLVPVKKIGGVYRFIAIKNMIPQVKRYSSIIISISVLFMVITFSTSMFNIIGKNDIKYTKGGNPGDITIKSVLKWDSKIDYSIMEDINKFDENSSVSFIYESSGFITNLSENDYINTVPMDIKPFIENNIIKADLNEELKDKAIISEKFSKENNIEIGSKIKIFESEHSESVDGSRTYKIAEVTVIGIMNLLPDGMSAIGIDFSNDISKKIIKESDSNDLGKFNKLIVFTENPKEYVEKLDLLKRKYPELKWSITEDLLEANRQYLFQRWAILIVVMGAILFIVILGAINSLMNDINNRRSEYALLRVLELKPKRVVQVIVTQVLTYITLGLIIGVISGEIITIIIMSSDGAFSLGFNGKIVLTFAALIYILIFSIILPFAIKISKKNIIDELKSEI